MKPSKDTIWHQIVGYNDRYLISSDGEVWNCIRNKIMKQTKTKSGYLRVSLTNDDGKSITERVHRLVAKAFIPNPENKPHVNHKDENKLNNKVENLEWVTIKENINYGTRNSRISDTHKGERNHFFGKHHTEETKRKLSELLSGKNHPKAVRVVLLNTSEIFDTINDASESYSVDRSSIVKCCRGKYSYAGRHPKTGEPLVWIYYNDWVK